MRKNVVDDHLEQRRRRQQRQVEMDRKTKETIGLQRQQNSKEYDAVDRVRHHKSNRVSETTSKINRYHDHISRRKASMLAKKTTQQEWLSSFYRKDPRWQIMKFFNEVAREGGKANMEEDVTRSPLLDLFDRSSVFTVWRPTSDEAIKNMMLGKATGKGLEIKGKSAKKGNISSYVPFIQIFEEQHKEDCQAFIQDGKTLVLFYQSEIARMEVYGILYDYKEFMEWSAQDCKGILIDEFSRPDERELAIKHLVNDDTNLRIDTVDTYVNSDPPLFGLEISERLFWTAYVIHQDCSRPVGTEWDIGRSSQPVYMDKNFKTVRRKRSSWEPRPVVYQMSKSPMEPRTLLLAYEENGGVKPVVSDFDCFLLGSRGVRYEKPISQDQVDLLKWTVRNIGEVLDEQAASDSEQKDWMETWFKVHKKATLEGYYPKMPPYGYGDPKSYEITQVAVSRLKETGCVRHGAECFNWFFPQEIDDELLVISNTLPGNINWKKVNVEELQDLLVEKIEEGFTFPINPKWVICDPGWRRVYDKLLESNKPNVQDSINCWLPPGTGLREKIDAISARHPYGFAGTSSKTEGTKMMELMQDQLESLKIKMAWRKLRLVLFWIRFLRAKRQVKKEREMAARALLPRPKSKVQRILGINSEEDALMEEYMKALARIDELETLKMAEMQKVSSIMDRLDKIRARAV